MENGELELIVYAHGGGAVKWRRTLRLQHSALGGGGGGGGGWAGEKDVALTGDLLLVSWSPCLTESVVTALDAEAGRLVASREVRVPEFDCFGRRRAFSACQFLCAGGGRLAVFATDVSPDLEEDKKRKIKDDGGGGGGCESNMQAVVVVDVVTGETLTLPQPYHRWVCVCTQPAYIP